MAKTRKKGYGSPGEKNPVIEITIFPENGQNR